MRPRSKRWGRSGLRGTTLVAAAAVVTTAGVGSVTAPPPASAAPTTCPAGAVALTFDDGPSATHTGRVLDVLAGRGVRATFFVTGARVVDRPALIARTANEGHEVANHTYGHERLTDLTEAEIRRTVDRTDQAIRAAGAPALRLVRPPGGATSARVRDVLVRAGYGHVTWTIDPQDWRSDATASGIRKHVRERLHDGAIILLHDGSANAPDMIAALPGIIDGARERGYCFAPLDEGGRLVRNERAGVFRDVSPASVHGPAIARLAELGVTLGCGEGMYCPSGLVTRAQMASFLQRALGLPLGPDGGFRDVPPGSSHAGAIGALAAARITVGCGDGRSYCPNEPIRRDQMASLLQRAFALPLGRDDTFLDVPPGSTHAAAIGAVHEAEITVGCTPDGRSYCPSAHVDRAQMASLLVRALDRAAT